MLFVERKNNMSQNIHNNSATISPAAPLKDSTMKLAFSRPVLITATKVALIVGTLLGLINHGPDIFANTLSDGQKIQIIVTYLVPYSVSTYSSVRSIRYYENIKSR